MRESRLKSIDLETVVIDWLSEMMVTNRTRVKRGNMMVMFYSRVSSPLEGSHYFHWRQSVD